MQTACFINSYHAWHDKNANPTMAHFMNFCHSRREHSRREQTEYSKLFHLVLSNCEPVPSRSGSPPVPVLDPPVPMLDPPVPVVFLSKFKAEKSIFCDVRPSASSAVQVQL